MASADLRDELTCSICLSIYTDPVTLTCGHSFCRFCIGNVFDKQEKSEVYTCPECRAEFPERPALIKNRKLCNIAESFLSKHPEQEEVRILCTYCIHSPVPAAKTCLLCEASLCENHLRVHSKSEDHILIEPTNSLLDVKCSVHKKLLEYYCFEDATSMCVYCRLDEEHRGHQVETLNEASEKKKEILRNILEKLTLKMVDVEKRVQNLHEHRRNVQGKAAGLTEQVISLIRSIREQLVALEKQVLSEINRQEEQVSRRVSDLIKQLEKEKDGISMKIEQIKKRLFSMTDPLTILQKPESDGSDYCDAADGDNEERGDPLCTVEDLDVCLGSAILHSGLASIVAGVMRRRHVLEASDRSLNVSTALDILLDVNTAGNNVAISDELKTISRSEINLRRQETLERFQFSQVLSNVSFSSGRHYWEVEGSESGDLSVGLAYPSIDRKGHHSGIGYNNKSWGLWKWNNNLYVMMHDRKGIWLPSQPTCQRLEIYLDYEAGRLSFYELCDPMTHLHTFTATFTEPLHACFCGCAPPFVFLVKCLRLLTGEEIKDRTQEPETDYSSENCHIYSDPVTLTCGHSYCQVCITRTWDIQEEDKRGYSCPECLQGFRRKPELKRNMNLCNIADLFVPSEPVSIENRKCSIHKRVLEYYCLEDTVYICVSCLLAEEHRGHQVETLNEVTVKKKVVEDLDRQLDITDNP
ncbi:E3 ubiquitin ISG15 ligase TRIM25-like, partial [Pelobates cultripes]